MAKVDVKRTGEGAWRRVDAAWCSVCGRLLSPYNLEGVCASCVAEGECAMEWVSFEKAAEALGCSEGRVRKLTHRDGPLVLVTRVEDDAEEAGVSRGSLLGELGRRAAAASTARSGRARRAGEIAAQALARDVAGVPGLVPGVAVPVRAEGNAVPAPDTCAKCGRVLRQLQCAECKTCDTCSSHHAGMSSCYEFAGKPEGCRYDCAPKGGVVVPGGGLVPFDVGHPPSIPEEAFVAPERESWHVVEEDLSGAVAVDGQAEGAGVEGSGGAVDEAETPFERTIRTIGREAEAVGEAVAVERAEEGVGEEAPEDVLTDVELVPGVPDAHSVLSPVDPPAALVPQCGGLCGCGAAVTWLYNRPKARGAIVGDDPAVDTLVGYCVLHGPNTPWEGDRRGCSVCGELMAHAAGCQVVAEAAKFRMDDAPPADAGAAAPVEGSALDWALERHALREDEERACAEANAELAEAIERGDASPGLTMEKALEVMHRDVWAADERRVEKLVADLAQQKSYGDPMLESPALDAELSHALGRLEGMLATMLMVDGGEHPHVPPAERPAWVVLGAVHDVQRLLADRGLVPAVKQ